MEALTMEKQMDKWNDPRLDELSQTTKEGFEKVDKQFEKVDKQFEKVDKRFERVEGEMKEGFAQTATKGELGEVKVELRRINDRFDRLLHALTVGGISFGIAVFGTLGGLLVTQI